MQRACCAASACVRCGTLGWIEALRAASPWMDCWMKCPSTKGALMVVLRLRKCLVRQAERAARPR
eukprot:scaffold320052_cov32-Tisochrysis_lutea.AAC.1